MTDNTITSYWERLLTKSPNWIDFVGLGFILLGLSYLLISLLHPGIVRDPEVPVSINHWSVALPLSIVLAFLGLISMAHYTQKRIVIPVFRTLFEAYIHVGVACTSIGMKAHFRIKRMGIVLAILMTAFIVTQARATSYREQLAVDDSVRRLVVEYIDRHYLNMAARPYALDLKATIAKTEHDREISSASLRKTLEVFENLYGLANPRADLSPADFRENLRRVSDTFVDTAHLRDRLNERESLDKLIYLSLMASVEHVLSRDGFDRRHAKRARAIVEEGLSYEAGGLAQANAAALPILHSFRNAVGISFGTYAMVEGNRLELEERLRLLEEAYDSFGASSGGPPFCIQRAANNRIDLELKTLRLPTMFVSALTRRNSDLGRAVSAAISEPTDWINSKMDLLNRIDQYLSLPEVSITRLQVISTFASRQQARFGGSFCSSPEFTQWFRRAEGALQKGFALGFDECDFFANPDQNHLTIMRVCSPPAGHQSLCDLIKDHFASDSSTSSCLPCG